MKTVQSIIDAKGSDVWTIDADDSVFEALEFMADKNIGAVMVTHGAEFVGIMSERDYARKIILMSRMSKETRVSEIMTPDPMVVSPLDTVANCMQLMTDNRFRHLPVVEDGDLVGLISIGDVVRAVIDEQQFMIDQLESYITG
jgi:signal-transduction protein with cAMP-binding, CBS, and nucleotidyltransferase domain